MRGRGLSVDVPPDVAVPGPGPGVFGNINNRFPSSKLKLDELFLHWLSLPDSQKLVMNLLDDAKAGKPLHGPSPSPSSPSPLSPQSQQALFHATTSTPPLSPKKGGSISPPVSPSKRSKTGIHTPAAPAPKSSSLIPKFYFPKSKKVAPEVVSAAEAKVDSLFKDHEAGGMPATAFKDVCKEVLELPSFLAPAAYARLDNKGRGVVTKAQFLEWWRPVLAEVEPAERMFHILRQPGNQFLMQSDFAGLLKTVLTTHPGLEFLQDTPEFQDRYMETVIYRIFYTVNRAQDGRISLKELQRSNLLDALRQADEEEDINKVLAYFSYEHFYVIYCKFWELDRDHDFLIDREDLLRYGNHALTYRIVDRIFQGAPRRLKSGQADKMGYEDFVWFILSEEDKTSELALTYWFRCVDLAGNNVVVPHEMLYFYEEQLHRMECLSQEPVLFADILCQMSDMLKPEVEGVVTLRDLKRCKLSGREGAGNFFNILFNLNKFIAFETRDPFLIRQEREDAGVTDWDRFARQEYLRLSMEEEGEDMSGGSEVWDDSIEAPF